MTKLKKSEMAYITAKKFFDEYQVIYFNSTPYLYNDGIWRREDDENTLAWIMNEYMKSFHKTPLKVDKNEIIELIRDITYNNYRKQIKYLNSDKKKKIVYTKDGVLNLETFHLKEYEPTDFAFHKLPFKYIKNPNCPTLQKFLSTSMGWEWDDEKNQPIINDDIDDYVMVMHFIQEWMGYSLVPGNPLEKCLIMYGSGRNGKGKLQQIWRYILGDYNVSSVDIEGINNKQMIFKTKNKLVNFSYDLEDGQQLDTGVIKSAISGEMMTVNEKWKPQYEMEFTAKLVIACNNLPYVKNTDFAIRERVHFLPFLREFKEYERDIYLGDKLKKEAEHIFSWAVNGLKRLQERGHFLVPERCKLASVVYMKNNDSIECWLDEDHIRQEDSRCKRNEVWKAYKYYCIESNFRPFGKIKFYERMKEKGFNITILNGYYFFNNVHIPNQTKEMGGE